MFSILIAFSRMSFLLTMYKEGLPAAAAPKPELVCGPLGHKSVAVIVSVR